MVVVSPNPAYQHLTFYTARTAAQDKMGHGSLISQLRTFCALNADQSPKNMLRSLALWLKSWVSKLKGRPVSSLLAIDWDETSVKVRVLDELEPFWDHARYAAT
jgi:hypothetical protein